MKAAESFNIKQVAAFLFAKPHLPRANGAWADPEKRGNCAFILNKDFTITWNGQIWDYNALAALGYTALAYQNNEPIFTPFQDKLIGNVIVSDSPTFRTGKNGSFTQAEAIVCQRLNITLVELRAYMKEHHLTWHECADGKTVQAVPTLLHKIFRHTGGIGVNRSVRKIFRETKVSLLKNGGTSALKLRLGRSNRTDLNNIIKS